MNAREFCEVGAHETGARLWKEECNCGGQVSKGLGRIDSRGDRQRVADAMEERDEDGG